MPRFLRCLSRWRFDYGGLARRFWRCRRLIWLSGRSVFQHAWTESPAVALLFGALFLLTARASGAAFAVAGVLSGVAFMQRAAMLPLVGVGVLAAAMRKEKKALSLALFLLGASVGVIRFFLEGKSEYGAYPLRPVHQIFHHIGLEMLAYLWKMGPFIAACGRVDVDFAAMAKNANAHAGRARRKSYFLFVCR